MKLFTILGMIGYFGYGEECPYSYKMQAEIWQVKLFMSLLAYFHTAPLKTSHT